MEKEFRYSAKVTFRQGDPMRISGGPYFEGQSGTRHHMGVRGVHTFSHLDDQGNLWVKNKQGALVMVYMGEEKLSPLTGTYLQPHKLTKIRKRK